MRKTFIHLLICAAGAASLCAASIVYTVSGDPNNSFVPDQFSSFNTGTQTLIPIGTLGNGSLGFNGGLTLGPGGLLYGIANDSSGNSSLYSVTTAGATTLVGSAGGLGQGFFGGLAYDPSTAMFYGAKLDNAGNATFWQISPSGVSTTFNQTIGTGVSGLAYAGGATFYAITNDNTGLSTLVDFTFHSATTSIAALGFGFGGLTYDPSVNAFWAISPVNNAQSQLFQVSLAGALTPNVTLGDGYVELAAVASTPEPATFSVAAAALSIGFSIYFLRRGK